VAPDLDHRVRRTCWPTPALVRFAQASVGPRANRRGVRARARVISAQRQVTIAGFQPDHLAVEMQREVASLQAQAVLIRQDRQEQLVSERFLRRLPVDIEKVGVLRSLPVLEYVFPPVVPSQPTPMWFGTKSTIRPSRGLAMRPSAPRSLRHRRARGSVDRIQDVVAVRTSRRRLEDG